jgi:hypothetical protein
VLSAPPPPPPPPPSHHLLQAPDTGKTVVEVEVAPGERRLVRVVPVDAGGGVGHVTLPLPLYRAPYARRAIIALLVLACVMY